MKQLKWKLILLMEEGYLRLKISYTKWNRCDEWNGMKRNRNDRTQDISNFRLGRNFQISLCCRSDFIGTGCIFAHKYYLQFLSVSFSKIAFLLLAQRSALCMVHFQNLISVSQSKWSFLSRVFFYPLDFLLFNEWIYTLIS